LRFKVVLLISFFADIVVKPEVQQALKRLGYLIKVSLSLFASGILQLGKCEFIVLNGSDDWEKVAENPTLRRMA